MFVFKYGSGVISLGIPEEKIINEVYGRPCEVLVDVPTAVREALRNPIGTPPLKKMVKAGNKVAILVSDICQRENWS